MPLLVFSTDSIAKMYNISEIQHQNYSFKMVRFLYFLLTTAKYRCLMFVEKKPEQSKRTNEALINKKGKNLFLRMNQQRAPKLGSPKLHRRPISPIEYMNSPIFRSKKDKDLNNMTYISKKTLKKTSSMNVDFASIYEGPFKTTRPSKRNTLPP